MLKSLLIVGLLTMGVGAKASTPINLGKQETTQTQKQYKQKNYENSETNERTNYTIYPTTLTVENFYHRTPDTELEQTEYYLGYNGTTTIGQINYIAWNVNYLQNADTNSPTIYYEALENWYYSLYFLKFTPNRPIINQTLSFGTTTKIEYRTDETPSTNLQITENYRIIQSTNNDFNTLFNSISPYGNNNSNIETTYKDIKNNAYSSSWTETVKTYNTELQASTVMSYNDTKTIEMPFPLISNTTNYILIFKQITTNINYEQFGNYYGYAETTSISQQPSQQLSSQTPQLIGYYTDAIITQEVIPLADIMWQILSMPFSFISTAFNLTIFEGTNYAINFSNLILTIFAILVFVFLFKLLLKK